MVKTKKSTSRSVILSTPDKKRHSRHVSSQVLNQLAQNGKDLKSSLESFENSLNLVEINANLLVSPLICSICAFNFNNKDRLPICLPCGHSICKTCVYSMKHSSLTGVCPFDRKEYFFIQELLPVNFSLLYTENLQESQTCPVHGFEIVAFCADHSRLLCGKCLISHLSHKFLDIENDEVKKIALLKVELFNTWEKKAEEFEKTWKFYFQELEKVSNYFQQDLKRREISKLIRKYLERSLKSFQTCCENSKITLKVQKLKEKLTSFNTLQQLKAEIQEPELKFPDYSGLEELLRLSEN
jgi:hypothetical protein